MKRFCSPALLLLLSATSPLFAQEAKDEDLTALQIMRHTESDHRADDERGQVEMVLVSPDGSKQRRKLEILYKHGEGDDDMTLIRFLDPPKVAGTAVLTLEATGRADDQWLYLPALKKNKRIASSNRTQRFAGTDFTFEDLRSEDYANWNYAKTGEQVIDRQSCWVIEATPKEGVTSGYSKREIYVEKARKLIRKVEYYDAKDRHQKTLELRKFKEIDGHLRAEQSMMSDHLRNTKTVWRFSQREINPGLPDAMFTPRSLERGS